MKSGWKTTEFWLAILQLAGGVALVLAGHEDIGKLMLGTGGATGAGYAISRGVAKMNNGGTNK